MQKILLIRKEDHSWLEEVLKHTHTHDEISTAIVAQAVANVVPQCGWYRGTPDVRRESFLNHGGPAGSFGVEPRGSERGSVSALEAHRPDHPRLDARVASVGGHFERTSYAQAVHPRFPVVVASAGVTHSCTAGLYWRSTVKHQVLLVLG